jgi:AcrR family transcriptional regulator
MPRTRTIPDSRIFDAIRTLLDQGGDKAVSFATVATATSLAAPTLVQRFGSRDGMVRAARLAEWAALQSLTSQAILGTEDKGPQALLKSIGPVRPGMLSAAALDPDLAQSASAWRASVEAALAMRLGTGAKARESAAMLFAVWQGQCLWGDGGLGFKLKEAIKRLT